MPYYEVIYESGRHSVACYEDDDEAQGAVTAHHERATNGEPAMADIPQVPAERVVRVLRYEEHPGSMPPPSADVMRKEVTEGIKKAETVDDVKNVLEEVAHPMVDSPPHESNYKMKEEGEVKATWL